MTTAEVGTDVGTIMYTDVGTPNLVIVEPANLDFDYYYKKLMNMEAAEQLSKRLEYMHAACSADMEDVNRVSEGCTEREAAAFYNYNTKFWNRLMIDIQTNARSLQTKLIETLDARKKSENPSLGMPEFGYNGRARIPKTIDQAKCQIRGNPAFSELPCDQKELEMLLTSSHFTTKNDSRILGLWFVIYYPKEMVLPTPWSV